MNYSLDLGLDKETAAVASYTTDSRSDLKQVEMLISSGTSLLILESFRHICIEKGSFSLNDRVLMCLFTLGYPNLVPDPTSSFMFFFYLYGFYYVCQYFDKYLLQVSAFSLMNRMLGIVSF